MLPTITDLMIAMGQVRDYPNVFPGAKNGIVFFCAAFYGRQDAIYFYDNQMKDVTLVDVDAEKMKALPYIYPKEWHYVTSDAFGYVGRCLRDGRTFDVVSCDPFTNLISRVLVEDFDKFYGIANRYLVTRVSRQFFEKYDVESTEEALAEFLTSQHGISVKVRELNHVSTFDGGIYWVVIKK